MTNKISYYFEARRKDKNGNQRILLRVVVGSEIFNIPSSYSCNAETFKAIEQKIKNPNESLSKEAFELWQNIEVSKQAAHNILDALAKPSKASFMRYWKPSKETIKSNQSRNLGVYSYLEDKAKELKKNNKYSNANLLSSVINSFREYQKNLNWNEINQDWLDKALRYFEERHLTTKQNPLSEVSINMYFTQLKVNYNKAKDEGIHNNPFKFPTIKHGSSNNVKADFLSAIELKQLQEYKPKNKAQEKALDLFWLMFNLGGCNFIDLYCLRQTNIKNGYISFIRQKTNHTRKLIKIALNDKIISIIQKWGAKSDNPNDYIFPLDKKFKTEFERREIIKSKQINTNKHLNNIGKALNLTYPLNCAIARKSSATFLKNNAIHINQIAEMMGHTNINITQKHYLKEMEDEQRNHISNLLMSL